MKVKLKNFEVGILEDDDGHLNVYIESNDGSDIREIDTGQGGGVGEQLALRFTNKTIEDNYKKSLKKDRK